jgi:glycosyltransferase involved in cell wall biosynthesis
MNPLIAGFAPLEWAQQVTFYATDDWAAHPAYRAWWPAYECAYERIRESGRAVCAVSPAIIDRIRPTGPHAIVPNGIEPSEWQGPGPAPDWYEALPRPRILYVGTLEERIDVGALRRVAEALPSASLVLVGYLADPARFSALSGLPNVHVRPPVGRADVRALVMGADVCVLPHHRNRLTEAMSPLKVYEYLAGGRPVVATDLPPVRGLDERIVLVPPGDDFAAAVQHGLSLGPAAEHERRAFLDDHAWARRHESVLEITLRT